MGDQTRRSDARALRPVAGMTVALLLAGCAIATPGMPEGLTAAQVQKVDQICQQTLGADPGARYFAACRSSLAQTVRRQDAERLAARVHADCARTGPQGSSEFALCVLGARPPAEGQGPLSSVSRKELHHRAELSCAGLGLDPVFLAFADCVSELETSILPPDDPSI
jgi:hypothetical protein